MKLSLLFKNIKSDLEITGIATNSKDVKPGYIFVLLDEKVQVYLDEAIKNGCVLIISDFLIKNSPILNIVVKSIYSELSRILNIFYDNKNIKLIGITGTDGKTTCSYFTSYLLGTLGRVGYIGTNGVNFFEENKITSAFQTNLTTLPIVRNYELLNEFINNDCLYAVMEVSSQGILNHRIDGLNYDYCVFTNLSHEHLDSHPSMEDYVFTKQKLFKQLKDTGLGIYNNDDNYYNYFKDFNSVSFGIDKQSNFFATNIGYHHDLITFDIITPTTILKEFCINRAEKYNLYNVLPAIIIALNENIPLEIIKKRLLDLPVVSGRLEKITTSKPYDIYIDFAHTPNALKNVLTEVKKKTINDLIVVCGAAGGKDISKRPSMGKIASEIADYVVFTSEDPAYEDPNQILDHLITQVEKRNYARFLNRKEAIKFAISKAKSGDSIIITGKGRENTYKEKGMIMPYSDYNTVLEVIDI